MSEAAHIKDVLAHLRVIENPRDAVSWNRILQLLEGIGPKTAQTLIEWILSASDDPFTLRHQSFSPRYLESIKNLFVMLRGVYHASGSVLNQLETIIQYYEPILKRKYFEDYPKRLQDLEHFITVAETFPTRSDLLASLALDPIEFTALDVDPLKEDEKPLVLSTIHSAKGLEFQTVFIIHALEGILPSGYAIHDPDALDEELRLLYVAVTRAKENLFISYPIVQYRPYAGEFFSDPCRFITTIPEEILEPWTLVEESQSLPAPRPATGDTETDTLPF